jgi:hypothetical protein
VILTKFLKIALLHVVLNWQKIYKTILERHFSLFFGVSIFFQLLYYADLKNENLP